MNKPLMYGCMALVIVCCIVGIGHFGGQLPNDAHDATRGEIWRAAIGIVFSLTLAVVAFFWPQIKAWRKRRKLLKDYDEHLTDDDDAPDA